MAAPFKKKLIAVWAGLLLAITACTGSATPTADAPRLISVVTLPPATVTPLRFPTSTDTPTITVNQVWRGGELQPEGDFVLITVTPPYTPTFTPSRTPRPTLTFTPSQTFTPSRTPLMTATFTPTRTPRQSPTPSGSVTPCAHFWFFQPSPLTCPLDAPLSSGTVYQVMEGGVLLELESLGITIVLYNDGGFPAWESYPSAISSIEGITLSPPPGLLPPQGNFAALWQGQRQVSQRLGWGLSTARRYTTVTQVDAADGTRYLAGAEGELFALRADQSRWQP